MATATKCTRCGDELAPEDCHNDRGAHDGCSPELIRRSNIDLPDSFAVELEYRYYGGERSITQFCPIGTAMMMGRRYAAAGAALGPWSNGTVTDPERFGPVPNYTMPRRVARKMLAEWVDAFLAELAR